MYELTNKVAVITGGSRGIGFGIAQSLAQGGAKVYILDIAEETAQEAVESLHREGLAAEYRLCDVTRKDAVETQLNDIAYREGHLDIMMNNAGVSRRQHSFECAEDDWDFIMNINLKAVFFNSVAAARIMEQQKYGRIINTCSINAFFTAPVRAIYAASKTGVLTITKYLAREYAPMGITVNGVAPGLVLTPLNSKYYEAHPDELDAALAAIPLAKPATPADIGAAVRFLASDAAGHITGHTIVIDGGTLLGNGKA